MLKPKFNPNATFEKIKSDKPEFNPNEPLDTVKKKVETTDLDGAVPEAIVTSDTEVPKVTVPLATSSFREKYEKYTTPTPKYKSNSGNIYQGYPGKESSQYRKVDGQWRIGVTIQPIAASIEGAGLEGVGIDVNQPRVEWSDINDPGRAKALDGYFLKLDTESDEYKAAAKTDRDRITVVNKISDTFVADSEEDVVPMLQKILKSAGGGANMFKVEEYAAGSDQMLITNKLTGDSRVISLDNWTTDRDKSEANILRSFIDYSLKTSEYSKALSNKQRLEDEAFYNRGKYVSPEDKKRLEDARLELANQEKNRREILKQYPELGSSMFNAVTAQNISTEIAQYSASSESFKSDLKEKQDWINTVEEAYNEGRITEVQWQENFSPQIKQFEIDADAKASALNDQKTRIANSSEDIDKAAQSYYLTQEKRGNLITYIARRAAGGSANVFNFVLGSELGEGFKDKFVDQFSPGVITDEYMNSEDRTMFEQIVGSLTENVAADATGALLTAGQGGSATSYMSYFANAYEYSKDQMEGPEFDDVPEYEKILLASTLGVVTGTLEKYGLSKSFSKSPVGKKLIGKILTTTFKSLPKNATAEVIELAINKNIKAAIANKGIQITGAGLIEASTEIAQESADIGLKEVFNTIKDKDYFDSPKTALELAERLGTAGLGGFMGGTMMNTAGQAGRIAKTGFTKSNLDGVTYDVLESMATDPDLRDLYIADLKTKVVTGEISESESKMKLAELDATNATFRQIPDNLKQEDKVAAFDLIVEKRNLEQQIKGKDAALVQDKTNRVNEINTELGELGKVSPVEAETKTEENAIQEQSTTEIPVQPKAEVSKEVETGTPASKIKTVTGKGEEGKVEKTSVYHGGKVVSAKDMRKGEPLFVSEHKSQAREYTKENEGDVVEFLLDKKKIATEDEAREIIEELGLKPKDEGWSSEELNLFELIDPKFETSLSDSDIELLFNKMKENGYEGIEFTDTNLKTLKQDVNNIVVFDPAKTLSSLTEESTIEEDIPKSRLTNLSSKKDIVSISDKTALREQVREVARAKREGGMEEKIARREVAKIIKAEMNAVKGKYSRRQVKAITRRALEMNLSNPVMAERFVDYVSKVVADAEYASKLEASFNTRKDIKKLSGQGSQQHNLAAMGTSFAKVDPRHVDDINEYQEMADLVKGSVTKSKTKGGEPIYRDTADVEKVAEYTNRILDKQAEIKKNDLQLEFPELFESGVLNKDMSIDDINEVLSGVNPKQSKNVDEAKLKEQVKTAFDSYFGIIESMIETKKDPFTGEDVDLDERQISAVKSIMKIDVDQLNTKQLLELVDMMSNFAVNSSTGKMVATGEFYKGKEAAVKAQKKIGKVNDTWKITRAYVGAFGSITLMLDNILGSTSKAIAFKRLSGLTDFITGSIKGENESTRVDNTYADKFKKKKANGERFNTAKNTYERGIYAFLMRNTPGDASSMQQEFSRRVRLIEESVEYLVSDKATKKERKIGVLYKELLDKFRLGDPDLTMADIDTIVDPTNREAVQWWVSEWGENYEGLSAVSEDVYNNVLSSDVNYTPDSFKKRDSQSETIDDAMKDAAMGYNDHVHNKESASLMAANKPKILPKDRYISLDFDINNSNSFKSAMIDLNTAGSIKHIQGFLSSDSFSDMFSGDNKKMIEGRIKRYILNKKVGDTSGKPSEGDQIVRKTSNFFAKAGVGYVLAGIEQMPKQTLSVIGNTLANTGGHFSLGVSFREDVNKWIENAGMPISKRGIESSTAVERAEGNLDKYSGTASQIGKSVTGITDFYLKQFLVNPDRRVAVASFVSFYKQDLRKRGLSTDIDYSAPMDQEAGAYAQHMVDRQQNISDPDMAGEFWISSNKDLVRKMLFPLANFVMNQKVRVYTDIKILTSKMSTIEDKRTASRSLAGSLIELTIYHGVAMLIREAYKSWAGEITDYEGEEDDPFINKQVESEKKRRSNNKEEPMNQDEESKFRVIESAKRKKGSAWKTTATAAVKDFFSPIPLLDDVVVKSFNWTSDKIARNSAAKNKETDNLILEENKRREKANEELLSSSEKASIREDYASEQAFKLWDFGESSYADAFGTAGIFLDKWNESESMSLAASDGIVRKEVFGQQVDKYLLPKHQEMAKMNNNVNWAYLLGLVPSDIGKISKYAQKNIEKFAFTKSQMSEYETLFKTRTGSTAKGEALRKEIAKNPDVISIEEEKMIRRGEKFKTVRMSTR